MNYIRAPSNGAVIEYKNSLRSGAISSKEFGDTEVSGAISILHIDGNHKYEEVRNDLNNWLPFVMSGGWILVDDYVWAFGDGPRRVGDELIKLPQVTASFVVGDTLCVRL
ncbi:hypothetical protein D3C77_533360 [compost metagenome]